MLLTLGQGTLVWLDHDRAFELSHGLSFKDFQRLRGRASSEELVPG